MKESDPILVDSPKYLDALAKSIASLLVGPKRAYIEDDSPDKDNEEAIVDGETTEETSLTLVDILSYNTHWIKDVPSECVLIG